MSMAHHTRITALPLAVAAIAAIALSAGSPAHAARPTGTLTFTATDTSTATPDPEFPKAGDTIANTLRNTRDGRGIGTDNTTCIVVTSTGPLQCATTVGLPAGTLQVAFSEGLTARTILAPISGGTGAYVGARGYFVLHQKSSNSYQVVGHLR